MINPFFEEHEYAIEYAEFKNSGWDANTFLYYCNLVSQLRSSFIIQDSCTSGSQWEEQTNSLLNLLLEWVEQYCNQLVSPDYNLIYALKRKLKYIEHCEYDDVGDLPWFYRSEADFRYEVEKHIFHLLNRQQQTSKLCTPYCSTRAQAEALQKSLIEEKNSIKEKIEFHIPRDGGTATLYSWARRKEKALLQIDELDAQIEALQWRLDEFDNGGEFDVTKNVLYVYKGFIKCQRDHHNLICVNAKILSKNGKTIYLNVNYCKDCHQFFISHSEYLVYRSRYGILIAKIVMLTNGEYSNEIDYLAAESPLKLCGYSVSQADGLSTQTRQELLRCLIQSNIINKTEVIRYLSWFIQMNGQKFGNEIAKSKWESDLDFVRDLDISKQDTHQISEIKSYPGFNKL